MSTDACPDWEFKERDVLILRELSDDPQLSSRELATILEEEHDICVSHVTVSESIRKMREEGVFRETIVPNEAYFNFALFEFKFNPAHFAEGWHDAMTAIRHDRHTLPVLPLGRGVPVEVCDDVPKPEGRIALDTRLLQGPRRRHRQRS